MSVFDPKESLGRPRVHDEASGDVWREVESSLSVDLPQDAREFLDGYGGLAVEGYLFIHHPGALLEVREDFAEMIARNKRIPDPLLPAAGGMLLWGNTIDGDQLFLVQRPDGWRVAAWLRQWVEWYESDLGLPEWISYALSPDVNVDWLPEWEFPLSVDEL